MSKKGSAEISQSVEESNKLREKLGIKPLREGEAKSKEGTANAPVHAPAPGKSDSDSKKKEGVSKKAKDAHKELVTGEGLGDILAREEGSSGAADWVNRTRNKDGSMKAANTAAASSGKKKAASQATESVPKMKVRHDMKDLAEGQSTILTLSDQRLLDKDGNLVETGDELSNVNLVDAEKAKHNDAIRKQVEYDPSKEGQDILEKYNELKTGPTGFVIGGRAVGGVIDEHDPEKKLAILTALGEKQSLESKYKVQSDFYTEEEMTKFRKPAKRKAMKRRKPEKADKDDTIGDPSAMQTGGRPADAGSDEEDPELYEQLSKQRRLAKRSNEGAMKKGEAALMAVSEKIQALGDEDEDKKEEKEQTVLGGKPAAESSDAIAMTATTEFCNVVQTPLEKMETLKHESFRGSTLYKQQVTQRKGVAAGEKKARKAMGAAATPEEIAAAAAAGGEEDIRDLKEDELDMSCASGLAYLRARSQIGNDQESHKYKKRDNRPLEMSTVDGDIKLEYRDDFGRVQTPKEAFRAISWKFHGKLPGRKNMERRLLRLENEMKLKTMDVMSSLPTLRALRHVQASDAKPYMVLTGANEK